MKIPEFDKLKTNQWNEKHFMIHYREFYDWLLPQYVFAESFTEKIYCYIHNINERPVCKTCGNYVKFISVGKGYAKYCSKKCSANGEESREKMKQTLLEKYGVTSNLHIPEVEKRIKENNLKKYGYENPAKSDIVKEKQAKTNIGKYGAKCSLQNKDVQEKTKRTMIEKYGTTVPLNNKDLLEKAKRTCLEHYGVEYPTQSLEIQEKVKQYNREKFGADWVLCTKEAHEKARQTCLEKYCVEYPTQSEEIQKKIKENNIKKYGVSSYRNLEKTRQTCLEKYGVEYPCMRPEARNFTNDSKPNKEFAELLDKNKIEYEREFAIGHKSYDFKIGDILVEIDPFATHNSTWGLYKNPVKNDYHINKTKLAIENGYRCIHVWDWDDKNKIIELLKDKETVYARKCELKEPTKQETDLFLNENHLQGTCKGQTYRIGLYYNNELIQIMTFGKPRYNKKYEYELLRLCTKNGYKVVGGAERCFKHFVDDKNPYTIISYCDNSKFTGYIYNALHFELKSFGLPSKHWYNGKTGAHITDNLLRQRGYDQLFNTDYGKGTSNEELMFNNNFVEIYDAGQSVYIYKRRDH